MRLCGLALAASLGLLWGCRATDPAPPAATGAVATSAPALAASSTTTPATDPRPLVIFLGDSLTAGFDLDEAEAYPALIAAKLRADGLAARVVNAGISGDTTAAGLARLDWLLAQKPDVLVVALGANDGLRGMPPGIARENLGQILSRGRAAGARVLLVGMLVPPSYGETHATEFARIFPELAREHDVPLVPFLLVGVAGVRELNLPDGLHPNPRGQELLAETVYPYVRPLVAEVLAARAP